jgi:glucose/arabinose dehydrogenase
LEYLQMRRGVFAALLLAAGGCAQAQIKFTTFVTGLSQPVAMTQDPAQPGVQYVVQKTGLIRVIQNGTVLGTNFINLSALVTTSGERGLLGLALPPDYATTGFAYVYYTDVSGNIQISRYTRSTVNPLTLNTATALKILTQAHPSFDNHNGGTLRFGPDGYLYAGLGDGGAGGDPNQNAQNPNTLLGKMIRIDPTVDDFPADPNRNYRIPPNNPFVDGIPITAMGEIWDFGLRNPWKWSFDLPQFGGTGALIIADVGQASYEEVDFEQPNTGGRNYGWRLREGLHSTGLGGNQAFAPLTDPIFEYAHFGTNGNSITGGYIYRGSNLGAYWQGRYFFSEEVTTDNWSMKIDQTGAGSASDVVSHSAELGSAGNVASIDVDSNGELYYVSFSRGIIYRLVTSAVTPTAITMTRGFLLSGGVPELAQSDDQPAVFGTEFTNVRNVSSAIIQLDTTAPAQTATTLRFFLEAQASPPGLTQIVEFWDWTTNSWVQIDSRTATTTDSRVIITASNPNRFIQGTTRAMRAQIRYVQVGALMLRGAQMRIDQAVWGFYP